MKFLAVLILLCANASARLGETLEQLKARLTVTEGPTPDTRVSGIQILRGRKGKLEILVELVDGKSSTEIYIGLSPRQVELLLAADSRGWEEYTTGWIAKGVTGYYNEREKTLTLQDGRASALREKAEKENAAKERATEAKEVEGL